MLSRRQPPSPEQGTRSRGLPSLSGDGPFALLRQLDEDMNRLFDEFGSNRPGGFSPQLEICEREGRLHVFADLPGVTKDQVEVDVDDGRLTIQGERRSSSEDKEGEGGWFRSERSYGSFYRSIALPEGIDLDSARADFRDGVLDVSFELPRGGQRSRRLEIGGAPQTPPSASAAEPTAGPPVRVAEE